MTSSRSLRKTIAGTEIKILQEGIPAAVPAESRVSSICQASQDVRCFQEAMNHGLKKL